MFAEPRCCDLRHVLVGSVDALSPMKPQGKREGVGHVFGRRRREVFVVIGHCQIIARRLEQRKNEFNRKALWPRKLDGLGRRRHS